MDRSVVLPLPDGPISKVSSPARSAKSTPLSARTLRGPCPSSLTMSRASITTLPAVPDSCAIARLLPSAVIG
jgi:hypothetical protein